jgi:hypothetical protein
VRVAFLSIIICLALVGSVAAQECVTCRVGKCDQMFWIPKCKGRAPDARVSTAGRGCAAGERIKLDADVPPRIVEGSVVGIRIKASCDAYLVVLDVEDGGAASVIWPSPEEPAPRAGPGAPAHLPSAAEVRAKTHIEAQLRTPDIASHESFVVFAFADRADFNRLKPAPQTSRTDGAAYLAELRRAFAAVPEEKRAELTARFVIEPRKGRPSGMH